MRICALAMVKNEADIIESFCRYTLTYCDTLALHDDNSADATKDIIRSLQAEFPGRIDLTEGGAQLGRNQDVFYNSMAKRLVENGADLVVPLDADEFLMPTGGKTVRAVLEGLTTDVQYQIPWRTYVYDADPVDNTLFLPANFHAYRAPRYDANQKVVVGSRVMGEYGYILERGSHAVYAGENSPPIETARLDALVYAHFPLRSTAQLMTKVIIGWTSYLSEHNDINTWGFHWHNIYDKIKQTGGVQPSDVAQLSRTYEFPAGRLDENVETVADDSWRQVGIKLQYTNYAEGYQYLPKVLRHFEDTLAKFHERIGQEEAQQESYRAQLAEAHTALQGIYASKSWRIAQMFQKLFGIFSK